MTIVRSKVDRECDDCHGPILAGEVHRGPGVLDDPGDPVQCWDCACQDDDQAGTTELGPPPEDGKLF